MYQQKRENQSQECLYYYRLMSLEVTVYPRKIYIWKSGDPSLKRVIHNNGNSVTKYSVLASNYSFLLVAVDQPASLLIINLFAYAQQLGVMGYTAAKSTQNYTIIQKNSDLLENNIIDSCIIASEQPKKPNRAYLILKQTEKQIILLKMIQYNKEKVHEYDAVYRVTEISECTDLLRNRMPFLLKFSYDLSKFVIILNKGREFQFVLCKPKNERGQLVFLSSRQNVREDLQAVMKGAGILEICENQMTFAMLVYNSNKQIQANNKFNNQGCLSLIIFRQNPIFDKTQTSSINFSNYYTNNSILFELPLRISQQASLKSIISNNVASLSIEINRKNVLFYTVLIKLDATGSKQLSAICYLVEQFSRNDAYEFRFYGFEEPCVMSVELVNLKGEDMLQMAYLSDDSKEIKFRSVYLNNKKNYENTPINSPSIKAETTQKKQHLITQKNHKSTIKTELASSQNRGNEPIKGFVQAEEKDKQPTKDTENQKSLIAPVLLNHLEKQENEINEEKKSKTEKEGQTEIPTNLVKNFSFGAKQKTPPVQSSNPLMSFGKQNLSEKQKSKEITNKKNNPQDETLSMHAPSVDMPKIQEVSKQKQEEVMHDVRILTKINSLSHKYHEEISDSQDKFRYYYSDAKLEKVYGQLDISQFSVFDTLKKLQRMYETLKIVNFTVALQGKKNEWPQRKIKSIKQKIQNFDEILVKKWYKILLPNSEQFSTEKTQAISKFYKNLGKSHLRISSKPQTEKICVTDRCFMEIQKLQQKIGYLHYRVESFDKSAHTQPLKESKPKEEDEEQQEDFKIIVTSKEAHKIGKINPKKSQLQLDQQKKQIKQKIYEKFIKKKSNQSPQKHNSPKQPLKKWKNFPIFRTYQVPPSSKSQISLTALLQAEQDF